MSDEDFVAIPTLGSLCEGWMLIVPRQHVLSFGQLSPQTWHSLSRFRRLIINFATTLWGGYLEFENGATIAGEPMGCSVDHAHLHLVPGEEYLPELLSAGAAAGLQWEAIAHEECCFFARKKISYVFVRAADSEVGYAADATDLPSQFFRRVIAGAVGRPDQWNWREHPFLENVRCTTRKFRRSRESSVEP